MLWIFGSTRFIKSRPPTLPPKSLDEAQFKLLLTVLSILVLTFLSQTFTGLNIGLMSLDTAQLQVLIDVPNKDETAMDSARYARKILPLRRKGNLLLCTILLGNTAVNALMAQLLADYAGGFIGFLLTTAIIVILCEIVPQSVCTRHGLFLGAAGSPIIKLAMVLFYPITKPYALVLDHLFPQRENLLDRSQLQALVEYQKSAAPGMLVEGQAEMLIGALGMTKKTVSEVMVPLQSACCLMLEDVLDFAFIARVIQRGYSRFPVVDSASGQVVGLLHCKDLLSLRVVEPVHDDPVHNVRDRSTCTVGELLEALRAAGRERHIFVCGKNTTLMALLSEFKRAPHLAVVADSLADGEAPAETRHLGIVTLHNIFGTILQAQVGFSEDGGGSPRRHRQAGALQLFDRARLEKMASNAEPLGQDEAGAVMSFLAATLPRLFSQHALSQSALLELLESLHPRQISKRAQLYQKGKETDVVTLVLQGALHLTSGLDDCESSAGPWAVLGIGLLQPKAPDPYVSDFSAVAVTDSFILEIHRHSYLKAAASDRSSHVDAIA
ncbi:Cnnm2 [Symbiodinium sp. CCMP2592]|nr:Cnnm2 [Symbiodinium sp. CCMP2592]